MRKLMMAAALVLPMFGSAAMAQDTLKIGYIDPLSGGGASIGEVGLKTFQFLADELNAKGGILGHKVEIVPIDNKTNPQESLVQAQKAVDAGIHYHHPGQRLVGRRRARGFRHQEQCAQSRQGNAVLQLCRGRSEPDQRQVQLLALPLGRQFGHQDGGADQLYEGPEVHQEGLPDQPGLFLWPGGPHRRRARCWRKAARYRDRRRRSCIRCSRSPTSRPISPRSRLPAPTPS